MQPGHAALAACAALVALLALAWPSLPSPFPARTGRGGGCPLGYFSAPGGGSSRGAHGRHPKPVGQLILFTNASSVWTGDERSPHVEAFVVDAGSRRFAFAGSAAGAAAFVAALSGVGVGEAELEGPLTPAAAGRQAPRVVDLQGAHVIPGLIDAHVHLIMGGLALSRVNLATAGSQEQLAAAVAEAAARLQPGQWLISGSGWDESRWGGELPTAAWIDAATGDTPAWLVRHDGHTALANTAALRLAGISAATPDPPGGRIVRGADGSPTGLLSDTAMSLVADRRPPLSVEERRAALDVAVQHALSSGVTGVHDMGRVAFIDGANAAWEDLEQIYAPAAAEGRLPLRVYAFVPLPLWRQAAERVRHLGRAHPAGRLFWGGVKEFYDGSLGSRTALLHEPYSDDPSNTGTMTTPLEQLRELVAAADGAGLQVAVHAIGDRAVDDVAALYAELAQRDPGSSSSSSSTGTAAQQPRRPLPHRIEHAQHLSPGAAGRLAAAGITVTPNPLHLPADLGVLEARLGKERAGGGRAYAFRTLTAAGVAAAFGSDWPVVPLEPLSGTLHAAVHRRAPGSPASAAWAPEEALSTAQALAAHTAAGAAAAGWERDLGRIAAGLLADFAVLSGPPGEADAAPAVRQTWVGGRCEWGCATPAASAA